MPCTPPAVGARREAERPTARREYESFDWYEAATLVVPITGVFTEVITFSGMPDSIQLHTGSASTQYRLRNPGEPPGSQLFFEANTTIDLKMGARIVEAANPTAAAGLRVNVTGRYGSRNIDRRTSRRGPLASDVRARDQGAPEQLEPRY